MMGGGPYDFIARFIYGSPISILCLFQCLDIQTNRVLIVSPCSVYSLASLWPIDFISDVSNWSHLIKRPIVCVNPRVMCPLPSCEMSTAASWMCGLLSKFGKWNIHYIFINDWLMLKCQKRTLRWYKTDAGGMLYSEIDLWNTSNFFFSN